jgi:hypothetical protein
MLVPSQQNLQEASKSPEFSRIPSREGEEAIAPRTVVLFVRLGVQELLEKLAEELVQGHLALVAEGEEGPDEVENGAGSVRSFRNRKRTLRNGLLPR